MAKSKDRLMLEKLLELAANNNLYEDVCDDGKVALKELAKYLGKSQEYLRGDPVNKSLIIYTDNFDVPDMFEDDVCEAEDILTVEIIVKKNGKKISVNVDSFNWY